MKQGNGEASIRSCAKSLDVGMLLVIGDVARTGMEESRVDQAEDDRRPL
jgi:hypothetical protein